MADDVAILDMSNPKTKRMVIDHIKQASGIYKFVFKRCRDQRSLQANAFLWGCVYKAIQEGLREAWGETVSVEQVHLMMKSKFLAEPLVDRETGKLVVVKIGSSAALDTAEFSEYLEKVIQFAAEYLKVEVPLPAS